ncbi:MAG: hypothetical protein M1828_001703 [Chrysothrix sp. TS-e1954]|nr:MAG: hypothetical protein M1828_001703 [Chrysothrix sp. TS-e1954]
MAETKRPNTAPSVDNAGRALSRPSVSVRVSSFLNGAYNFAGLYFATLLSMDSDAAAQGSQFSTQGQRARRSGGTSSAYNEELTTFVDLSVVLAVEAATTFAVTPL